MRVPMSDAARPTVAMIGLGVMGGPMTDHVIGAGFPVRAYDVAPDALAARSARGAVACISPADAAAGAEVVGIVVFDDAQVRAVLEGATGVLAAVAPGTVIALHSTVLVDSVREFAAAAEARGAHLVDAGITGGEVGAKGATLVTMVGGDADVVTRARPVFATFSKAVLHVGPLGTGMALKLARNLAGYVTMAAVHEAMVLAHHAGVDVHLLAGLLREPAFESQVFAPFAFGGPEPLPPDDERRAFLVQTLRLAEKDLDDALALARADGVHLTVSTATRQTFADVMRLGGDTP
jgi:3-hydroxyisobutyrate dehydrogenase-like beta-hydroxyacid dehydrogenase